MNAIRSKLPLRIIKTCISLFISYITLPLFTPFTPFFAGIGAMRGLRESMSLSVSALKEQTIANLIGMTVAFIFGIFFGSSAITATLAVFVLFLIIKHLGWHDSYVVAAITMTSILLLANDNYMLFLRGFDRVFATLYGMLVAFVINFFVFKPNFESDINEGLKRVFEIDNDWLNFNEKRLEIIEEMEVLISKLSDTFELATADYEFNKTFFFKNQQNVNFLFHYLQLLKLRRSLMQAVVEHYEYVNEEFESFYDSILSFEHEYIKQLNGIEFDELFSFHQVSATYKNYVEVYSRAFVSDFMVSHTGFDIVFYSQKYYNKLIEIVSYKEVVHEY